MSNDEICAAVRDCFEDSRAMLEPAGAISIAGAKKYIASLPTRADGSKGNFIAISSDASNIEFGILRFIADRASIGEQSEARLAPPLTPHSYSLLLTPYSLLRTPYSVLLTIYSLLFTRYSLLLTRYS